MSATNFYCREGPTGLSVALDLPTQCGYDPDDAMARPRGRQSRGFAVQLGGDGDLFASIDLSKISTSFTINGTAAIIYAMYIALADKAGVPRSALTGTIQNDILKEYVARGTWIFPVRPSMRLIADTILFSNEHTPRFNPISIAGAHVRDAGATAVEEMAYTLANGLAYVDELLRRGGDANSFARRLSFFFYVHMDFFEEVAKFRAGRRIWAKLIERALWRHRSEELDVPFWRRLRRLVAHRRSALQQYLRVAIETMAAVLGGAQSIFTCAYDEAFQIPTEFSAEIALRTQQIIAYESGIAKTVDPLGGSYFIEWLTDEWKMKSPPSFSSSTITAASKRPSKTDTCRCELRKERCSESEKKDAGETVVVGENYFTDGNGGAVDYGEVFKSDPVSESRIRSRLVALREERDASATMRSLDALERAARTSTENLMPYLIDCCHAYATLGEMVARLKACWGEFSEPIRL